MKNVLLLGAVALLLAGCFDYSEGERVGVINKFSRKGLICKTWEGEMNLGGFRNKSDSNGGTSVVANIFQFTVEDETLIPKIKEAMASGETVTLGYRQELFNFCNTDSGYFITSVEAAKK